MQMTLHWIGLTIILAAFLKEKKKKNCKRLRSFNIKRKIKKKGKYNITWNKQRR